jgi:hypothetical protein
MNPNHADSKHDKEVALAATTTTKFKGVCGKCKKHGHMARDCKQKKSEETGRKNLRPCRHCGGKHMDYQCWELPQNAKNRPTNWVSKKTTESANVAADVETGPMVELLLSNIDDEPHTFSHQQDMLLQPGIWIGDTAATVHMSPHQEGMVNMKKTGGGITVGKGEVMVAKQAGDIPCEIMDKYGNPLKTCVIKDVALTKSSSFNMFSLTKMMKQGWTLGGDQETGITLSKGDQKLTFDIPIETPKGVVYAIYINRSEVAAPALPTTMSIEKAHHLLGHQSEDATRKTAKSLGWTITKGP